MSARLQTLCLLVLLQFLTLAECRRGTWIPVPGGPTITCAPPIMGCTVQGDATAAATPPTGQCNPAAGGANPPMEPGLCATNNQINACYVNDCATNLGTVPRCRCANGSMMF